MNWKESLLSTTDKRFYAGVEPDWRTWNTKSEIENNEMEWENKKTV